MTFCLVYEDMQKSLLDKIDCLAVTNQIVWNAVLLVQGLQFIENRERFSPKDSKVKGNSVNGSNHTLGFTGFEVDDFKSDKKRKTSIFTWFEQNCHMDDAIFFPNVEILSQLMNA